MWHRIEFVAESRKVDAEALVRFAKTNEDRFGIVEDTPGELEVSTWHVDALVSAFFSSLAEPMAGNVPGRGHLRST